MLLQRLTRLLIREAIESSSDGGVTSLSTTVVKILKALYGALGIRITKSLGAGFNGISFMASNGHVIKITYSNNDAAQSEKLLGKKPKHFPAVYHVFKVNLLSSTYAIDKEFIASSDEYKLLVEEKVVELHGYLYDIFKKTGKVLVDFDDLESLINSTGGVDKNNPILSQMRTERPELFNFFNEAASVYKEAMSLGLTSTEYHYDNLGERGGMMCFYDFSTANLDEKPVSPEPLEIK